MCQGGLVPKQTAPQISRLYVSWAAVLHVVPQVSFQKKHFHNCLGGRGEREGVVHLKKQHTSRLSGPSSHTATPKLHKVEGTSPQSPARPVF